MSDEGMDQMDRADDRERDDDVQAHSFDQMDAAAAMEQLDAKDEPPDVEGHQLGGRMDPKPID